MEDKTIHFFSLRWRVMIPVFAVVVTVAALLAYLFAMAQPTTNLAARQVIALSAASGAAFVVILVFLVVTVWIGRMNRISRTAKSLTRGQRTARTHLQPTDEIGKIGHALDQYADYAQEKQDELRLTLRRKRREIAHMTAVLESLPDGIIVQDLDGRVILMNEHARKLLGSQRVFRSSGLHELTSVVTDVLGLAIAPGIYSIGDPQNIDLDGKIISAQAAAVMSVSDTRLGTVILLRDITAQVREARSRELLLRRLETDIQQPLAHLARSNARNSMMYGFAREVTQHTVALQRLIMEIRDISEVDVDTLQRDQKPILLETLIWAISNEWRQIAQANNLTLQVIIEKKGLYVLGDERRLRWAVGNIIDNAIKYTPPGGTVTLEIRGEENGLAQLRIRDNGAGIADEELPFVFTRFYRGNPTTQDGRVLRVPGMGQGLYVARQIIEGHGGAIRIKSKPEIGTAVYFMLPLTAAESLMLPRFETVDLDGDTVRITGDES